MDNKKLLKFLYKDINEIEELVTEKGAEGFDEFEIEFIQSRFKGARQLIQILSEKENKQLKKIRPRPVSKNLDEEPIVEPKSEKVESVNSNVQLSENEVESLEELTKFEEELKETSPEEKIEEIAAVVEPVMVDKTEVENEVIVEHVKEEPVTEEKQEAVNTTIESKPLVEEKQETEPERIDASESDVELDEEEEIDDANHRLGDSFSKEKSVNELLGNDDSNKLEYKISNSPVESITAAIGINDRYQYIRELFDGNGDRFTKAVSELDNLNTIQEAVTYLQQNYKWKKNDVSLKFVNLVKRRFPNG